MKILTTIDLNELIIENYDPDDVLEILGLTTEDLVNRFSDVIWTRRYQFTDLYGDDNDQETDPYET